MTSDDMLGLPWSWRGPTEVRDDDGTYWELRIDELPDFCVFGETRDAVSRELFPSLRAFLDSYVEHGDPVPLPEPLDRWVVCQRGLGALAVPPAEEPQAQPQAISTPATDLIPA